MPVKRIRKVLARTSCDDPVTVSEYEAARVSHHLSIRYMPPGSLKDA